MPRIVRKEVGKIYETRKVKTFGDKLKEWIAIAGGIAIFLWIVSHIGG